jgi:TRAP-type transport system small permease protein
MLIHVLRIWMDQGAAPVFRGETEVLVMNEGGVQ